MPSCAQVGEVLLLRLAAAAPEEKVVLDALRGPILSLQHLVVVPRGHALLGDQLRQVGVAEVHVIVLHAAA
eukprot:5479810-Pleurochrysis_carterae.AAC.1